MDAKTRLILLRLDAMERELQEIKRLLSPPTGREVKSLRGILGPVEFTDADFEEAKRSWSRHENI